MRRSPYSARLLLTGLLVAHSAANREGLTLLAG